jgi:hypothetical protein
MTAPTTVRPAACQECGTDDIEWSNAEMTWLCINDHIVSANGRARSNGRAPTTSHAERLTAALGLAAIGAEVAGAHVFGAGPTARVDIHLSNRKRVRFERFGDIVKPAALSAHLLTQTGIYRAFKGSEAGAFGEAVFALAQHDEEDGEDAAAVDWASEFLRLAPEVDVRMDDQDDRWRGFSTLAPMQPSRDAGGPQRIRAGRRGERARGHREPYALRPLRVVRAIRAPRGRRPVLARDA